MKANNRQLLFSAIIVIACLVLVDIIVGKVGDYAMEKIPNFSGQIAKDNYRLNRVTTDIIIVGSSRGSHHYVATMLKDSINCYTGGQYSLYNGAIDGKFINSNSCSAESIMDRYKPRLLIFEVSESELGGSRAVRDMEFAAVNYNNNQFVKKYLDDLGWKERIKIASNMFRYNQKVLRVVSSFIQKGGETGYEPLYKRMIVLPKKDTENIKTERDIDEYSLRNFTRVLQTAREKGVLMVAVSSPRFSPTDNNEFLSSLCAEYGVPYIELYNLELFNTHPEYFQDASHLNDDGAHVYTGVFFDALKPYLTPLME